MRGYIAIVGARRTAERMKGQRKLVTILFADIVGSTTLAGENDAAVVQATLDAAFDRIAPIVRGVLVDSERISVRISSIGLTERGWPLSEAEVIKQFLGRSDADTQTQIVERLGTEVASEWAAEFPRRYRKAFESELRPIDGVVQALDEIQFAMCVASSGTHEKIRHSLSLVGLLDRFDGRIFSASDVARGKPAPDLFLHAAATMNVPPVACVVVEDSPSAAEAAHAAGMRVFGYAGGVTPPDRLATGGTIVFTDMRELPALLAK